MEQTQQRAHWGSRLGFILAAAGSAVGLGNIWKFPYITGENGGGLFVLIYLVCIALVGIPIMAAEIMIGRAAQKQPIEAFHTLQGRRTAWAGVGWLGVITGFVILSYYIVVAGWAMDYTVKSFANFTAPIHDAARAESDTYLATTPIDKLRDDLLEYRAAKFERARHQEILRRARPSDLAIFNDFNATLGNADDPRAARAQLLADAATARAVTAMEPFVSAMAAASDDAQKSAEQYVASLSEATLRRQAADVVLRRAMAERVGDAFGAVSSDGWLSSFWALILMLITISIVAAGVSGGIERTCRVLMPLLFALILFMVFYGAFTPGFDDALRFVFNPDVHKLQPSGVLEALGHAFFTLSLGMGAMITYGSYQRTKESLTSQSVTIAGLDTGIALLACLMIFPIIMSYDQEPAAGPGLVFVSMPLAFAELGRMGMLLGIVFFGLLVFAALTSAISLLEVVASYLIDGRGWPRAKAAWVVGMAIFAFSLPTSFSYDPDFLMKGWASSYPSPFFDTMDYLASNWMLPVGGLLISLYAGWVMPKRLRDAELDGLAPALMGGWLLLVRFVAPTLVIIVLLQKIGVLDANEIFYDLLH